MNHPSDATLALFAGQDLGWLARRRTERHVARCERCRREVEAYSELREDLPEMTALPDDLHWNRLAAEMKANIRLGLAAGECVRDREPAPHPGSLLGTRELVSYASILALVTASFLLERPTPRLPKIAEGVTLEATSNGIALKGGGQTLSLLHERAQDVTFSAGAQGSMRARYVDSETGHVTINNVYAQ
jgi:hypothetical protein